MSWDAGAITGSLELNISEFSHGMIEASAIMEAFPPLVVEFLQNPLIATIGIAKEVAVSIKDMVGEVLGAADDVGLMAQKAGTSVEFFSKLSFAAKDVKISQEQLSAGIKRLQLDVADAVTGNTAAAESFHRVGISTDFLKSHLSDGEGLIRAVLAAIDRLPPGAERSGAAIRLLGRSGSDLVPLLAMGSEAIDRIGESARQFGALEDDESARGGRAWRELMTQVDMATEGMKKSFGEAIAPELMGWANQLLDWVKTHMPEIRAEIQHIASEVKNAVEIIGPAILFLLDHLDMVIAILGAAGLGIAVTSAIKLISTLGAEFAALAVKIGAATAAETGFNAAAKGAAGIAGGAGIGAGIGGAMTGDLGGTIGGGIGGLLGGIIGQTLIPIPGVGFVIGSALGGLAGGQIGSGLQHAYQGPPQVTANVNVNYDPAETANQLADKIQPQLNHQYSHLIARQNSHLQHALVNGRIGGAKHYAAGF
jgi:hypothetical protein